MKSNITKLIALPFAFLLTLTLPSCEESKGPLERAGEAIDDATDSRPAEGLRDAAEDASDAIKDAVN
jgi:hypothetical protein